MQLLLKKMRIENFKGIKSLEIEFDTQRTSIFGKNGSGKSSIADAFSWCLFGKDSKGNASGSDNFRDKPLDTEGHEVHNLDTLVELVMELDGTPFNVKKVQSEIWTKKRGNANAVYGGNQARYWINGVETKVTDFKARIAQLVNDEVFRLVSCLSAYNAMDWKKRRTQLLAISDTDVDGLMLERSEYRQLADAVAEQGVSVDDFRKVLDDRRKKINADLKMIPIRIDEATKSIPVLDEVAIADAKYMIADAEADIDKINEYIAQEKYADGSSAISKNRILDLQQRVISEKRRLREEYTMRVTKALHTMRLAEEELEAAQDAMRAYDKETQVLLERQIAFSEQRNQLISQWKEERGRVIEELSEDCPYCGQKLPNEKIAEVRAKLEADKKKKLEEIQSAGTLVKEQLEKLNAEIESRKKHFDELGERVSKAADELTIAKTDYSGASQEPDYDSEPSVVVLLQQLEELQLKGVGTPEEKIASYNVRKAELNEIIRKKQEVLATVDLAESMKKRIEELGQQQKTLGVMLTETDALAALAGKFIMDRCAALEESINSKFPTVRWKLFDVQINGGIVDCCICMCNCDDGYVPYECANTASQVNADIEIINVLSEFYNIQVPLFVDNAERINVLAETGTQLITLSVSTDSELVIH